jgi:hypothetical protein
MMDGHISNPFAPVILGLAVIVVTSTLAGLAPGELVTTLTATPLRQAVSAIILLGLISLIALGVVSRASVHLAATVGKGGDE